MGAKRLAPPVEDLDDALGPALFDLLVGQPMGGAVIVVLEHDVVVDVDVRLRPAGPGEVLFRQRAQGGQILIEENAAARTGPLLEGPVIQLGRQRGDTRVEFAKGVKRFVAQSRQDPALHNAHAAFYLGLVARLGGACWQHSYLMMGTPLLIQGRHIWIIAAGFADTGLEVVGHDQPGSAAEEGKGPRVRS